jgi:hypothetical protein
MQFTTKELEVLLSACKALRHQRYRSRWSRPNPKSTTLKMRADQDGMLEHIEYKITEELSAIRD